MSTTEPPPPTEWVGISPRGEAVLAVSCTFLFLFIAAVALRLFTRWKQFGYFLADDIVCILSMVLAIALFACPAVLSSSAGLGWHVTAVPLSQRVKFFKWFYAAEILYAVVSTSYKLSLLLLFKRIFGQISSFNRAVWITIAISCAWGMAALFPAIFQCTPVKKAWYTSLPGHCIDTSKWILGNGIANLLIDAIILILPMPLIWRLQLTSKKKVALTGIFLLGALVCVASLIRITTALVDINFTDPTYGLYLVTIWSQIETSLGIVCACLPTLRQAFSRNKSNRTKATSYYSNDNRTPFDGASKPNGAIGLTGWRPSGAYTEIEISSGVDNTTSHHVLPSAFTSRQEGGSTVIPGSSRSEVSSNNEVFITKEVTVQENLEV